MKLGILAFSIVIALASIFGAAAVVQTVSITACTLDTTTYACSATVYATCQVLTSWDNTVITSAQFSINDYSAQATRIAGVAANGTWRASFTNDQRFADVPLEITRVAAITSSGYPCSSNGEDRDVDGCYVRMGSNVTATNSCSCQIIRTEGATNIDNTRQVTLTPSAGCSDQTPTTYVEFADYCDPNWVSQQSVCAPTASTTDDPFVGTTTKTYTVGNPSCCTLTSSAAGNKWYNHNTGSDCSPPIDYNTEAVCTLQPVTQGQIDVQNTAKATVTKAATAFSVRSAGLDTNPWQALAYDFDVDGSQEIVTIQPGASSFLRLYSSSMSLLATGSAFNVSTGQPAIAGITKYSNGTTSFSNYTEKILVPATSLSGSPRSKVYVYTTSGSSLVLNDTIDGQTNSGIGSVLCVEDECYFADLGSTGTAYRYYLNGLGEFAFPPLNGLFLLNGTYQGPLVDGALYYNMRVQNLKPVLVKAQTNIQDDLVVFFSKHNVNLTGTITQRGVAMVTIGGDVVGTHTLENQVSGASTLTLRNAVVLGRNVYVPYEELIGTTLELGVFVINIQDTSSNYISNPGRLSTKVLYWSGDFSTSDEGISNAAGISSSTGVVQVFTRTPSDSLAETEEMFPPTTDLAQGSASSLSGTTLAGTYGVQGVRQFVHTSGNYMQFGYLEAAPTFPACNFRGFSLLNGGTSVSATIAPLSGCGGSSAFRVVPGIIDAAQNRHCVIRTYSGIDSMFCYSYSNPTSPSLYSSTSAVDFLEGDITNGASQYGAFAVDGRIMLGSRITSAPVRIYDMRAANVVTSAIHLMNFTLGNSASPAHTELAAYDSASDVYMNGQFYLSKYGEVLDFATGVTPIGYGYRPVTTTSVNYSGGVLPGGGVSGAAFNWNWNGPRYIGVDGIKYTISSFSPLATTATVQSCSGRNVTGKSWGNRTFIPLYYNSEDHILGLIYSQGVSQSDFPNPATGAYGTRTMDGPVLGYCDFSTESAPTLHSYDVEVNGQMSLAFSGLIPNIGLNRLPAISIYENDGAGDGEGFTLSMMKVSRTTNRISCTDIGATWSCTLLDTGIDACGSYGPAEVNNECGISFSFDETRTAPTNVTGSSTETIVFDAAGNKARSYSAPFVKRSMIGVADATGDGSVDVINSYGVFDFTNTNYTNYFGNTNAGQSVVPLDQNGDGAVDVLITGTGIGTALYTATSTANAILTGPLEIKNLRCTVVPGTASANIQVAASVPNPSALVVRIDPGDGRGSITQLTSLTGTYLLAYAKAGTYTVTAQVYDSTSPFSTDTSTCQIEIPAVVGLSLTDCSIGSSGEFDYSDSVLDKGWSLAYGPTGTNRQSLIPSSGKLNMLNRVSLEYPLTSCNYQTFTSEAKLIPFNSVFEIKGDDGAVAIRMAYSETGPSLIYDEAGQQIGTYTWNGETYVTAGINIDALSGQVYYYLNGQQLAIKNKFLTPTAVKLTDQGLYDYVRTSVSGTKLATATINPDIKDLDGDATFLTQCDADGNGEADVEEQEGLEARRSYPSVGQYCGSTTDGRCSFAELGLASGRYPDCTKEVYNYCVYESFRYETGSAAGGGITGGTSCTALLLTSAGIGNIAVPTAKIGWSLFLDNMMWILAALAMIILVMILTSIGRRK